MVKQEELEQKIIFDEPMKKHTSFKIGGTADYFFKATTLEELQNIIKFAKIKEWPITIIGNGSNLLVTDKGIRGLVIKIDINKLKIEKKDKLVKYGDGVIYYKDEYGTHRVDLINKIYERINESDIFRVDFTNEILTVKFANTDLKYNINAKFEEIDNIIRLTYSLGEEKKVIEITRKEEL